VEWSLQASTSTTRRIADLQYNSVVVDAAGGESSGHFAASTLIFPKSGIALRESQNARRKVDCGGKRRILGEQRCVCACGQACRRGQLHSFFSTSLLAKPNVGFFLAFFARPTSGLKMCQCVIGVRAIRHLIAGRRSHFAWC